MSSSDDDATMGALAGFSWWNRSTVSSPTFWLLLWWCFRARVSRLSLAVSLAVSLFTSRRCDRAFDTGRA
jgi:hypothetical protein